jgi:hypothetical protein
MEYSLQLHTVVSQPMGFLMPTAVISFHEMWFQKYFDNIHDYAY